MSESNFPLEWVGAYEYDYNPVTGSIFQSVAFQLSFQFANKTDFVGQVRDAPDSPMPEPGTIRGKLVDNKIEFVKQMPVATYLEQNGKFSKFDCAHPKIFYTGEYIPEDNLMVGAWHIEPVSSGAIEYFGASGTWHADAVT